MKNGRRYVRIRFAGDTVACAIAMAVVAIGFLHTSPAQAQSPAVPAGSGAPIVPSVDSQVLLLDFRDAPVRAALEILLNNAAIPRFSVDNRAVGYVTCKGGDKPLTQALDLLCSSAEVPLTLTIEAGTWFIRASPLEDAVVTPKPRKPVASTTTAPATVSSVPRRVAGVLILAGGHSYAMLETGVPYGATTQMTMVETGGARVGPSHVPSGVPGVPDLTLTSIDAKGVTLTNEHGSAIRVPLASAQLPRS